jgi:hypothetical protein
MSLFRAFAFCLLMAIACAPVGAQIVVTEVDPSGTDPADPMDPASFDDMEWIEITNCGTSPFDADGTLWYDDESGDWEDATQIAGLGMIAPGESVIAVNLDDLSVFSPATGVAAFQAEYPGYTGAVGFYLGSGMSGNPANDDGAVIWAQATAPVDGDMPVSELIYPNAPSPDMTFQASCSGVLGTFAPSPGSVVPEPSAGLLLLLGLAGLVRRRR